LDLYFIGHEHITREIWKEKVIIRATILAVDYPTTKNTFMISVKIVIT